MESSSKKNEDVKEQLSNVSPPQITEAVGMRRDNDSIDDFEHLEPESSPTKEIADKLTQELLIKPASAVLKQASELVTDVGQGLEKQLKSDDSLLDSSSDSSLKKQTPGEVTAPLSSSRLIDLSDQLSEIGQTITSGRAEAQKPSPSQEFISEMTAPKGEQAKFSEQLITAGTEFVSKYDSPYDLVSKLSDKKASSQAFMDYEREVSTPELVKSKDKTHKFVDDLEFLDPELKTDKVSAGSAIHPAVDNTKDEYHSDDNFQDSDSLPEIKKSEEKVPKESLSSKSDIKDEDESEIEELERASLPVTTAQNAGKATIEEKSAEVFSDVNEDDDYPAATEFKPEPELQTSVLQEPTKTEFPPSEPKPELITKLPVTDLKDVLSQEPHIQPKSSPPVPTPTLTAATKKAPEPALEEIGADIGPHLLHSMGFDAWFQPDRLHPKVVELVYWRDPKKSGIVFGSVLGVLLSLSYFSLISVIAYLSLIILSGTISFRIYKNVLQAVQKTSDGHPFKEILDVDLTLPQDKVREVTDVAVAHLNAAASELRRLFLVEDLVDSIKFGVLLWCLTYVGSWFNGMTLIIIAFVALFTLPKVYENNKPQIDQNLDIVRSKLADITSKVKAAVPIGKKPAVEEKKEQ